jgi:hypothetical protein
MSLRYSTLLFAIVVTLVICNSCKTPIETKRMSSYSVKKINSKVKYNFSDNFEGVWKNAILLEDFSQPWLELTSQKTTFRALYDDKYLYLRYNVVDSNILLYNNNNNETDVIQSDRIEIFFRKDLELSEYYCLEIDPTGKVLDYSASYYRKFDFSWTWPKGHLYTNGKYLKDGYEVDVRISLESLQNLNLFNKVGELEIGIYRADCISLPNENKKESIFNWITWVNPGTSIPDFHVPSSFGVLKLMND